MIVFHYTGQLGQLIGLDIFFLGDLGSGLADGSLSLSEICSYITFDFRRKWCLRLLRVLDGWVVLLLVESESLRSLPDTRNLSRADAALFVILRGGHIFLLEPVWCPTWRLHGGSLVIGIYLLGPDIGVLLKEAWGLFVENGPRLGHHRKKIAPYFLSYPVGVRTNTPLKQVLGKLETSGRLIKWAIELSEYDISYLPRTTIQAQAFAHFVSEMTGTTQEEISKERPWLLHIDGSSTAQGSRAGIVLTTPQGDDMEFAIKFEFKASNNEAEYEAVVLGMRMAQDVGASHLLA
ncbi:UNVERIFIED_CONTAM: hypothetical protein Slati_3751300 [Sesamum latifolium]|uniref:RNase H type-1 domain-containing protein n=1 Tax=Sesamum latifolium TaxID=2727402 RepID=A0AAW2U7B4_9LAMI